MSNTFIYRFAPFENRLAKLNLRSHKFCPFGEIGLGQAGMSSSVWLAQANVQRSGASCSPGFQLAQGKSGANFAVMQ
jgi:hypothetical protein